MVTKLYIVFVWTDQKRFKTDATFGQGFFEKGGKKSPNLRFHKCGLGLSRGNILNEIMILLL